MERCCLLILHIFLIAASVSGYKPLSDSVFQTLPSSDPDLDPHNGRLLAPILTPRVPGTAGHSKVQEHFVSFFKSDLPRWTMEWQNSTSKIATGKETPFANLIFRREPPWTKPGQANLLTFAAHYDSKSTPPGFVGAANNAASCAILMHVARSLDKYVSQMYDEMQDLGEGGTVPMDMGVQILFLDGKEALGSPSTENDSLYGSRYVHQQCRTQDTPNRVDADPFTQSTSRFMGG
jgi:glutaminyl-peptide cyclotransferase